MTGAEQQEVIALRRDLARLTCDGIEASRELRTLERDLQRRAESPDHLTELLATYAPLLTALRARVDASEATEQRLHALLRRPQ